MHKQIQFRRNFKLVQVHLLTLEQCPSGPQLKFASSCPDLVVSSSAPKLSLISTTLNNTELSFKFASRARPDLHVAQGMLIDKKVLFLLGIEGVGIRSVSVTWKSSNLPKLMFRFIYRLYKPAHFADPP